MDQKRKKKTISFIKESFRRLALLSVCIRRLRRRLFTRRIQLVRLLPELLFTFLKRLLKLIIAELDQTRLPHQPLLVQTLERQILQQAQRIIHTLLLTPLKTLLIPESRIHQIQADSIEYFDSLTKKHVPHAQNCTPRQRTREYTHKPLSHVQNRVYALTRH